MRRLLALVKGLPPSSLTHGGWDPATHLAALNAEIAFETVRTLIAVNSAKGSKPPDPLRIPRPGDTKPEPRQASPAEVAAFFRGG